VRSAEQVRSWVRRLADQGSSVVYMSTELEEIIEVSDRVAVMVRGRITGVLSEGITIGAIGNLMLQER
ncbi:MAG: heme ABC transporter ATP-binding protein, partial [bacterium]|nr:heme ABC transporter ATP-binding protein [bacterium]